MKVIYQEALRREKSSRTMRKWDQEAKKKQPSQNVASSRVAQRVTLAQAHGKPGDTRELSQSGARELEG